MPSPSDPEGDSFETASWRLNQGLKSCRTVISGYRLLLARNAASNDETPEASFTQSDGPDRENAG